MINLQDDRLTFTFPEIAAQLSALLEQHIQQLLPKLTLPKDRNELVNALKVQIQESDWTLRLRPEAFALRTDAAIPAQKNSILRISRRTSLDAAAESLTEADVEKALRERAYEVARLHDDSLASVTFAFQRTLRIPDDGKTYPLPAGLDLFPLRAVDDFAKTTPASWIKRGGVLMPMYQSEALWIEFSARYPFAVKVAAGKINAVSGEAWSSDLQREPQNYVVLPEQPWLDGFAVGEGVIRQFVAMPLGAGYSVEEQLTGQAEFGGVQFQAYPMRAETYFREKVVPSLPSSLDELLLRLFAVHLVKTDFYGDASSCPAAPCAGSVEESMGLGAGGQMRQEIYHDPHSAAVWDETLSRRCFVHLCNSLVWRQITGTNPPHPPLTAQEYKRAGIPWFDYYRDDQKPLKGSQRLAGVKSVTQLGQEKHSQPLPENSSITPELIVQYGNTRRPGEIREFLDTL